MSQAKAATMTEEAPSSSNSSSSFSEPPPVAQDTLITTESSPQKNQHSLSKEPVLTVTPADDMASAMIVDSSAVSSPEEMAPLSPSPGAAVVSTAALSAASFASNNSSSSSSGSMRVTRSQSTESGSQQDTPEPAAPLMTRKRTRRGASSPGAAAAAATTTSSNGTGRHHNKRIKSTKNGPMRGGDDNRETRNTHQRMTKEAREARRAQREAESKERLAELDELEAAVKNGTHPEYIRLLQEIEHKRVSKISITKARFKHAVANQHAVMTAATKAAHDHFQLQKQGLRRQMIQHVQQQISSLEQEYYSHNVTSSLDDQHLSEWTPRHRPSRLHSIVVPLTEDEAELDFSQMCTAVAQQQKSSYNRHASSSPKPEPAHQPSLSPPLLPPPRHQPPFSDRLKSSLSPTLAQKAPSLSNIPPLSKEASSGSSNPKHGSPSSTTLDEFPLLTGRPYYSGPSSLMDHRPPPSSPTNQLVK